MAAKAHLTAAMGDGPRYRKSFGGWLRVVVEIKSPVVAGAWETPENPGHPRDNSPVIAGQDWVDGRQTARLSDYELITAKKQTKREKFLSEMGWLCRGRP
jgi:hypothetical protein